MQHSRRQHAHSMAFAFFRLFALLCYGLGRVLVSVLLLTLSM